IRALTARHPIKPISASCRSAWQPNLGRRSTYRCGNSVQTTGTTSVVGITDHFRIATARGLADALTAAGVDVLIGFEASSSEGVHLLCLFPGSTQSDELERIVGRCGVSDLTAESPPSDRTCQQLLELIPKLGGITIAAHACSAGGILTALKGQPRG